MTYYSMGKHTSTVLPKMHRRTLLVLAFILTTIFASTCNGRPTGDQWNLKDLGKRSQLGEEILDSISMKTRLKRQAIKTTFERNVKLQSRSQWFLAIEDDGTISGSANFNSLNVKLRIKSVGPSLVRIYGIKAKKYLAMSPKGKLYSTTQLNQDTQFKEYLLSTGFHTFSSANNFKNGNPMYLALRDNGQSKKGFRARKSHKSAQFSVITTI